MRKAKIDYMSREEEFYTKKGNKLFFGKEYKNISFYVFLN